MNDMAKGTIIGFMIAVILAGFAVAVLDFTASSKGSKQPPAKVTVARIGPGGKPGAFYGDNVNRAVIPGSQRYDVCLGEIRVQRPSTITSDMPTAFCTVTRNGRKGPWHISTGGWQQCQAVCVRFGGN